MKKCQGCSQEIDKYAIACEYCGKLAEERKHPQTPPEPEQKPKKKNNKKDRNS